MSTVASTGPASICDLTFLWACACGKLRNLYTLDVGQHAMTVEGVKAIVARLPPRMRVGVFPRLKRLQVFALLGGNRIGAETEATPREAAAAELQELRL